MAGSWRSESLTTGRILSVTYHQYRYKFCSKKDILHYLTAMKNNRHTSEMQSSGDNRQIVGSQVRSSQECLPPGWILEIRVHKSGGKAGQKYKSYYDPSSGSRFYSKADVFRFLGSRKLHTPTPKQKRCSHTMDNALAQVEYSPDGLPPGWIKEIIVRKSSRNGKGIRKDPYYIDPDHEYVFRSLKDAIHYVATGEVSKHAVSQGRRKRTHEVCSLEVASPTPSRVKELNSLGTTIQRCLFTEEVETLNAEMATGADDSSKKIQLPLEGHASSKSTEKGVSIDRSLDMEYVKRKTEYKGRQSTRTSKRLAGCGPGPSAELVVCRPSRIEKGDSIELPERKKGYRGKEIEPAAKNMLENSTHVEKRKGKSFTLPSRASKRLAGCEPASVSEPVIHRSSCDHGKRKTEYSRGKEMDLAAANTIETSKHANKRKHKVVVLPSRASKRLAGREPDPVAKLSVGCSSSNLTPRGGNEVLKIEERVPLVDPKSDSFSEERGSAEPVNEQTFPAEQIATGKKTDDRPTSPLTFPFLDAWGDPCIEFAVKTLLGEIPVPEIPEFVRNQMSAVPTPGPTSSATVEFGRQSCAEISKPSGLPEELQNQHAP